MSARHRVRMDTDDTGWFGARRARLPGFAFDEARLLVIPLRFLRLQSEWATNERRRRRVSVALRRRAPRIHTPN